MLGLRIIRISFRSLLSRGSLSSLACIYAFGLTGVGGSLRAQESGPKLTKQETQFFESRIRPILVSKCYSCHSVESGEAEGGLRLDSREAMLRGGSAGPAVQPKEPTKSLIIKAIEYHDPNLAMPPKSAGGKLEASQIKDLIRWVRMGAPDPRKEEEHLIAKEEINESAKQ